MEQERRRQNTIIGEQNKKLDDINKVRKSVFQIGDDLIRESKMNPNLEYIMENSRVSIERDNN